MARYGDAYAFLITSFKAAGLELPFAYECKCMCVFVFVSFTLFVFVCVPINVSVFVCVCLTVFPLLSTRFAVFYSLADVAISFN